MTEKKRTKNRKNRKLKIGRTLILLGLAMFIAAGILTAKNLIEQSNAGKASENILAELLPRIDDAKERAELWASGDTPYYPDYVLNPNMDMPVEYIDGIPYIGTIEFPSLERTLPVIGEWSYEGLKKAPCCYKGSVYRNNMVLCGHNYRIHFGPIGGMHSGDRVLFTDVDGNLFTYEIVDLEIVGPYDVSYMVESGYDLTLFTCTLGGASRVTVRCNRIANES